VPRARAVRARSPRSCARRSSREIDEDLPIGARAPDRQHGPAHALNPAFGVREDALLLGEDGRGEHHVGEPHRLGREGVLDDEEVDPVHPFFERKNVRLREQDVLAHHEVAEEGVSGLLHHLVQVQPGVRRERHSPGALVAKADFGVVYALVARIEDGCGARIVGALHVVLAAQRVQPRRGLPEVSRHEHEVGERVDVVGAVGVLGDAERVVDPGPLGRRVATGGPADRFRRHPGDLFGRLGRVRPDHRPDGFVSLGVLRDEGVVGETLLDDHVGHRVQEPDVAARAELQVPLGEGGHPDRTWIRDDERRPATDGALHLHRDDGMRLAGIATDHEEELRVADLPDRVRHRPGAEGGDQTGHRGGVSGRRALVDVVGPVHGARELLDEVVLLDRAPR
jgi:hypothetical protein